MTIHGIHGMHISLGMHLHGTTGLCIPLIIGAITGLGTMILGITGHGTSASHGIGAGAALGEVSR